MAGRKKLPTKLKKLKGTARKDRLPDNEPTPKDIEGYTSPPKYLGDYGIEKWDELYFQLQAAGILTEADLSSFTQLCKSYENMMVAYDGMTENKTKSITEYLNDKQSNNMPFYRLYKDGMDDYKKLLVEFGMTPSSRGKIEAVERPNKTEEQIKGEALLRLIK